MEIAAINHVTLIVDDLERARRFYTDVLGLEELPVFPFDYPTQFYRVNETQQLHLTEWEDASSFRGHVCLTVSDFDRAYATARELDLVDERPWGKVRELPDGAMQMFIRDPAGNLLEISYRGPVDQAILDDPEVEHGTYVSGRNDPRGTRSADATLYHER
jgi:catechol 2,3-dioxygenase-like lactoylglutathione lyase family enzyme